MTIYARLAIGAFSLAACGGQAHPQSPPDIDPTLPPMAIETKGTPRPQLNGVKIVTIAALADNMLSGTRKPPLPGPMIERLRSHGQNAPVLFFRLCLDETGGVNDVAYLDSDDQKNLVRPAEMTPDVLPAFNTALRKWRFKPFEDNGQAIPVCTAVMFFYDL